MLRLTSAAAPSSPALQKASGIPFAALVSPLAPTPPADAPPPADAAADPQDPTPADLQEAIARDAASIPRCAACAAYLSALAEFTPRTWTCPLCQHCNALPARYAPAVRAGASAMAHVPELSRPVYDLVVPDDGRRAALGDLVSIDYELALEDGEVVDSTLDRGRPATFRLGAGEVPAGVEEGVIGMRQYGRRRIVVPPELGYGDEGAPPLVPPGATLRFEVELMELEPADEDGGDAP